MTRQSPAPQMLPARLKKWKRSEGHPLDKTPPIQGSTDTVATSARPSRAEGGQQEVPMRTIVEDRHLPVDINALPVVQAAAALKPTLRYYQDNIEREQRLSPELVEQMHAAGFYRLLLPRALGGLQADPLTYIRVVELLAEGAGSGRWSRAHNGAGPPG